MPLSFKPDPSMNNYILSNKRVLAIATMLSFMMLAASAVPSLVPTTAFAQQSIASDISTDVDDRLAEKFNTGEGQQAGSQGDDPVATAAATEEEPEGASEGTESSQPENGPNSEINLDSQSEEDTSRVEEDDFVTVDPILQNEVQTDLNVNVDTGLVMDEEDCEEAQNEVVQGNGQQSDQQAGGEGRVGDGDIYVSPKSQLSEQFAMNANVDVDVVLVEGCNPVDDITQVNAQGSDQGISSDLSSSPSGTVIIPADQRADKFAYNLGVNRDFVMPVL
jgi:hypothetical protein